MGGWVGGWVLSTVVISLPSLSRRHGAFSCQTMVTETSLLGLPRPRAPCTEGSHGSPTFDRALRALGKHARAPTTHDSTRYGISRSSPHTFLAHHRAAISAAVVLADATTKGLSRGS